MMKKNRKLFSILIILGVLVFLGVSINDYTRSMPLTKGCSLLDVSLAIPNRITPDTFKIKFFDVLKKYKTQRTHQLRPLFSEKDIVFYITYTDDDCRGNPRYINMYYTKNYDNSMVVFIYGSDFDGYSKVVDDIAFVNEVELLIEETSNP
jgi:hypothetical protein